MMSMPVDKSTNYEGFEKMHSGGSNPNLSRSPQPSGSLNTGNIGKPRVLREWIADLYNHDASYPILMNSLINNRANIKPLGSNQLNVIMDQNGKYLIVAEGTVELFILLPIKKIYDPQELSYICVSSPVLTEAQLRSGSIIFSQFPTIKKLVGTENRFMIEAKGDISISSSFQLPKTPSSPTKPDVNVDSLNQILQVYQQNIINKIEAVIDQKIKTLGTAPQVQSPDNALIVKAIVDQLGNHFKAIETSLPQQIELLSGQIRDLQEQIKSLTLPPSEQPFQSKLILQQGMNIAPVAIGQTPEFIPQSKVAEIAPEIQQILDFYDRNPSDLEQQYSVGVSETKESFNQRWSGLPTSVVLERASNYNFLIVSDRYLLPKPNAIITSTKLNTFEGIFYCDDFQPGGKFQVIEPAIVTALGGDRWQVERKGKLKFFEPHQT